MRVHDIRINGLKEPIGYAFHEITVSWKVSEACGTRQKEAGITIAKDREMSEIVVDIKGDLDSNGQVVHLEKEPRTTYFVKVSVIDNHGECATSEVNWFETGKIRESWMAKWIGMYKEDDYHPVFVKQIRLDHKIQRARLYVCGVGIYEAYLNEEKIGENFLAPFLNDYNCALQNQTYDVTNMLGEDNQIEIMLGNGWYKGRLGYDGKSEVYGDWFGCIAELHMEYVDGTKEVIVTDESWQYYGSDIEYSDIYDGEGINRLLYANTKNSKKQVVILDKCTDILTDSYSIPLKVMEEIAVQEILYTQAGEWVLDFGQNFSGFVMFRAEFPKGTKVLLEHGEILQEGNFYHDNYRTAKTEIAYTSDGRSEWVRPHFTYMGFRYVKVSGWPYDMKAEDFIGQVVYSEMEQTGYLETGHEMVNQLISNALWGLKSNFLDMPTDCPQRDERLGWTGDAQVFAPTAAFFMDTRAFYRKFLWDMRNDQILRGGAIAHYLPNINGEPGGSSVWGDAATFIPAALYENYGDTAALTECYPLMKDWVEWIRRGDENRAGGPKHKFDFHFSFGDWLAMDGVTEQSFKGGTEDAYVSTVYYYASVKKLSMAAKIVGKVEEYETYECLAEKIRETLLFEYFTPGGRLAIDTQTGYIIALYFGVYREKEQLVEGLRIRLKKDGYRIKCGFVGAPLICETLAGNGLSDLAFHIFLQEKFPSWLHCVSLGATTIWERWNSVLDDGSISGTGMNSLNHYAFGSVIHYAVADIAGLQPLEPGYRKVRIAPQFHAALKYVNCTYDSVSGKYTVSWKINEDGSVSVKCKVPFNCEATVVLPGYQEQEVYIEAGTTEITYSPDQDYRYLYHWNTILEELARNKQALEILKEELPIAYGMAKSDDIENLSLSLEEMKNMPFLGLFTEDVERAAKRLFLLKANI